ncbi:MAG: hypothetical protein AOA66_0851 [Candidatus Bathyarchaeota archaeon BA2]|nr:MAG: hypothetical protein AOA66_0851 [Candidatus Bathyarchaeota archaeon BA2]
MKKCPETTIPLHLFRHNVQMRVILRSMAPPVIRIFTLLPRFSGFFVLEVVCVQLWWAPLFGVKHVLLVYVVERTAAINIPFSFIAYV